MTKRKRTVKETERVKDEISDILTRMIAAEIRQSQKAKRYV